MRPGWTPPEAAGVGLLTTPGFSAALPAAGTAVMAWCPVCGDAPGRAEYGGFCSRSCRTASLDYHNRQEIEWDRDMERNGGYSVGGYVHDPAHDRKRGPLPRGRVAIP